MDEIAVTFFTNGKVLKYLNQAIATGFYGKTVPDAVERIVAGTIEDMVTAGQLDEIEADGPSGTPGAS